MKVFRLPEFPPPLAYHYVQNYYSDMVASLGKAINATPPDESALLARYCEEKKLIESGEKVFVQGSWFDIFIVWLKKII